MGFLKRMKQKWELRQHKWDRKCLPVEFIHGVIDPKDIRTSGLKNETIGLIEVDNLQGLDTAERVISAHQQQIKAHMRQHGIDASDVPDYVELNRDGNSIQTKWRPNYGENPEKRDKGQK